MCNIDPIVPTLDWRTALILDANQKQTGGLTVEWPTYETSSAEPFNRASALPKIHATSTTMSATTWSTVNCTSMEDGCHACVGPTPNVTEVVTKQSVTLIPFGATDVRIAILPVLWSDRIADRVFTV